MADIYLIRHAQSRANAGERTTEPGSIGLTQEGRRQALRLAGDFSPKPELIVTSRYERALRTALPMREKYPDLPFEVWEIQEFTYLSPKKYRGTTVQERGPMARDYWEKWDPCFCDGPGAESFADFIGRCRTAAKNFQKLKTGPVAAFSHQQFIAGIQWALSSPKLRLSSARMRQYWDYLNIHQIENCQVVKIDL